MPRIKDHATYPCGYQRSIEANGWFIRYKEEDKPCPIHGQECRRIK